ncbi:MAG: hypothetical protein SH809_19460 [Rhodothermales bacterium]|nr:hypothetical protein [Rhodothermales bacterium]
MPFNPIATNLEQARRQKEQARLALHLNRERQRQAEAERAKLDRRFDPENDTHQRRLQQLEARLRELAGNAVKFESALADSLAAEGRLVDAFLPFSDPRQNLGQKDATLPIALFPVRLETRFKPVTVDGAAATQLWVRVYPDECLVDTFESLLSESERESTRFFWINWAKAGGLEAEQRAAWAGLVGSFGSGRAAWLIEQQRPADVDVWPAKADPNDLILAIAAEAPLPATERPAAATYWTAAWRAEGDGVQIAAAQAALKAAVGAERAAVIAADYAPANFSDTPASGSRADAVVQVMFVDLPSFQESEAQRQSWSQAPRVNVLPERFVLLGYRNNEVVLEHLGEMIPSPLIAGPDPLAPPEDQLQMVDGDIVVGAPMQWMVDFDEAERVGMGFRITLSPADAQAGFDQLMVLGVRLSADETAAKEGVETLFRHHQQGTAGFSILPNGSPTNNTEGAGSGFSLTEDADASFDVVFKQEPLAHDPDFQTRLDGQWLADTLGVDLATFDLTPNSRGRDQCEARAMNVALWPATLGYQMETLMQPVFSDETIEEARWFFTHFVTGRGLAPAIRVGKQPYGILPATVYSRLGWLKSGEWRLPDGVPHPEGFRSFLQGLDPLLQTVRADWAAMADEVAFVGQAGDPHQLLLDIVGLTPSSIEFYQRYAESREEVENRLKLMGVWSWFQEVPFWISYPIIGMNLLQSLGYTGDVTPEILEKFFLQSPNKLTGPIVDDVKLSETAPIRAYTDTGLNYIEWLAAAARTSLDQVRLQDGFTNDQPPTALLYLLLRYAIEQGYFDAGLRLYEQFEVLDRVQLQQARIDPSFIHVSERLAATAEPIARAAKPIQLDQRSESRYEYLYRPEAAITGSDALRVVDFIPGMLGELFGTRYLTEQLTALDHLAATPTARLERAFAEHLDLVSYRLDAWRWGLLHYQIASMRYRAQDDGPVRRGVYVGAFGYLENVRSENKVLTPVELDAELTDVFKPAEEPVLVRDSTNGGFIHAPSINHAIAAAVLRNGYLANATSDAPDALKVNLSSARVRVALGVIEGIRNGQTLGALLGYQLERGLHDRHEVEIDIVIYTLRKAFPLVADRISDTQSADDDAIEAIEARNVLDGLALADHIRTTGQANYPFGKALPTMADLGVADPAGALAAVDEEVNRMLDIHDAVADLAMAEGVYQAVQGNYTRTGAALDAYARGTFPPEPQVVQTPRSGLTLLHRVGIHLPAGLDGTVSPNALLVSPRAEAEPAVNTWMNGLLPDPSTVVCHAAYTDPAGVDHTVEVTQAQLGLQPIDLLFVVNTDLEQAMAELDDRVVQFVVGSRVLRPDVAVAVDYTRRPSGARYSFFEVAALLRHLRAVVLRSRPLVATDIALVNEATQEAAKTVAVNEVRITGPLARLEGLIASAGDDLVKLLTDVDAALADPVANRTAILAEVDIWAGRFNLLAGQAVWFGMTQAAPGFVYDGRKTRFAAFLALLDTLLIRWDGRLTAHIAKMDAAAVATSEAEGVTFMRQAEAQIATDYTVPEPATRADYAAALAPKRAAFDTRHAAFLALREAPPVTVGGLAAAIAALLPVDAFDIETIDVASEEDAIIRFAQELRIRIDALGAAVTRRIALAHAALDEAAAEADPARAANARVRAGKALFGEDFKIVPEFTLGPDQADEILNAWSDRDILLTHLTDPAGPDLDFPVDDWLYGVARVREKMGHWEQASVLAEAFGRLELTLTPLQLPYRADDRWVALPFPDDYDFVGDRLLYTAHFSVDFDRNAAQCGLLVDEWTEVVPAKEETTGLTFHYDRPNSEPPQTILLALSPAFNGGWTWNDLVDSIRETMDEARLRAVEPAQVDESAYAAFLPAAIMASTRHPITIMLNLAMNNQLFNTI